LLLDYYIGQCGIEPNTFWQNTFNENIRLSESFQIKQNLEWERLRYLATMMINLKATKSSQRIQPTKLFKLPHDTKNIPTSKPLSKKDLDKLLDKWNNIKNWKKT
tara:strand:- start:52 stop:366 length:315 start_codon:yes stop_codon:yes gene_type:complete